MKIFEGRGGSIFLLIPWLLCSEISGIRVDLYLNKDKFGEFLRLDISEKGCTNVPLNWDNQAVSLDTHGSCVKFYDLPYCRGKYVALQAYHGTFQDNLETLNFKQLISSASPCGPKVPSGRYYILNGADGSLLTMEKRNGTVKTKTLPFKPYITKNQQFQIDKISVADYEIIPRVFEDLNPLTYDMSVSSKTYPVRRTWKIESVYRGKYLIKNEWNNRCLYKSDKGSVEEHDCVPWSPNQEWMFKAIKIQPFFPSKEQLTKQPPQRPDEHLAFQPQIKEIFPQFNHLPQLQPGPGEPLFIEKPKTKETKTQKDSDEDSDEDEEEDEEDIQPTVHKPHTGHNPIVINPHEPFPPVQGRPIYPKGTLFLPPIGPDGKPDFSKPPVPQVRYPGQPPFPRTPVVMDPKKTSWPAALVGGFGPTPFPTAAPTPKPTKKPASKDEDEGDENEKDDPEDNEEDEPEEPEKPEDGEEEADDPEGDQAYEEDVSREREESSYERDEEE